MGAAPLKLSPIHLVLGSNTGRPALYVAASRDTAPALLLTANRLVLEFCFKDRFGKDRVVCVE